MYKYLRTALVFSYLYCTRSTLFLLIFASSNFCDLKKNCEIYYARKYIAQIKFKVTPYSYLARGDWVLKWRERAQFSIWYVKFYYARAKQGQF